MNKLPCGLNMVVDYWELIYISFKFGLCRTYLQTFGHIFTLINQGYRSGPRSYS